MSPRASGRIEALRDGETRYRQLTEQATDIIYNCDLDRALYVRQSDRQLG